ncbi:MAG: hypothetical protein PWQ83_342 [Thermosipho sp. (in: thermotogales)]|nr:hypothetical protein [Thermosipho sp. (in: thermotogales)]MDK2838807.1 hypothetical protein [Thermosipho sp. (in: thermotogales)]
MKGGNGGISLHIMEKNLSKLFSASLPGDDLVAFVSVFFSLGFAANFFFSFTNKNIYISNTIFLVGILGYLLIAYKWCSSLPKFLKNNVLIFYNYVILSILFCFLSYFFPLLFLISGSLVISLIIAIDKKIHQSNIFLKIMFILLTLTFYLLELAPDVNFRLRNLKEEL